MKEITTYADQYYEVNCDGYYKKFGYVGIDPFEESEEDRIAREGREKAVKRNESIDSILG